MLLLLLPILQISFALEKEAESCVMTIALKMFCFVSVLSKQIAHAYIGLAVVTKFSSLCLNNIRQRTLTLGWKHHCMADLH